MLLITVKENDHISTLMEQLPIVSIPAKYFKLRIYTIGCKRQFTHCLYREVNVYKRLTPNVLQQIQDEHEHTNQANLSQTYITL